jgi:hypothetical protein
MSATGAYFIRGGFFLLIGLMALHAGWSRVSDINLSTYTNLATNVKLSIVEFPAGGCLDDTAPGILALAR